MDVPATLGGTARLVSRWLEADKDCSVRFPASYLSTVSLRSPLAFISSFAHRKRLEFLLLASALGTFLRFLLGSASVFGTNDSKEEVSQTLRDCTVSRIRRFPR